MLLRRDLGELVSVMERNPGYSMKTLDVLCESARGLARRFLGIEGMRIGGVYLMLVKKYSR
jgi:hypothetical protein